jgi:hypothetical protein
MAKIKDMYGVEAEVFNISFNDYKVGRYQKSPDRIYRVGSGECGFYYWDGAFYENRREVEINWACKESNLQAWIEGKI